MSEQRFHVPNGCPSCGAWVCAELFLGMPSAVHCGSQHDDSNTLCDWRLPLDADAGAQRWTITTQWRAPVCPGCGAPPAHGLDMLHPMAFCETEGCQVFTWDMRDDPARFKATAVRVDLDGGNT